MYPSSKQLFPGESVAAYLLWSEGLDSVSIQPVSISETYFALDSELNRFGQLPEARPLTSHELWEGMACVHHAIGVPPLRCEILRVHAHGVAEFLDIDTGVYYSAPCNSLYLPTQALLDFLPMSIECEYFGHQHYATLGGPRIVAAVHTTQILTAFVRSINPDTGRAVINLYDEQDRDVLAFLLMDRELFDDPWAVDEGFSEDDDSEEEDPELP